MQIFRWIIFLPAAIAAGIVSMVVCVFFFGPSESVYARPWALISSALDTGLSTAVTLLVARAIAPSKKPWVLIFLASILIVLNLLEIKSAARTIEIPTDRVRIAESLGFITAATIFLLVGVSKVRHQNRFRRQDRFAPKVFE